MLKKEIELKEDLPSLKEKFIEVDKTLEQQEQHWRKNCLFEHGVDEKNNDDTNQSIINIMKEEMGEDITIHDIDRTQTV